MLQVPSDVRIPLLGSLCLSIQGYIKRTTQGRPAASPNKEDEASVRTKVQRLVEACSHMTDSGLHERIGP